MTLHQLNWRLDKPRCEGNLSIVEERDLPRGMRASGMRTALPASLEQPPVRSQIHAIRQINRRALGNAQVVI